MIDLHCHSTVSDGALPPDEVVALAAQNGCTMLALTDHDHTGGLAIARATAQQHGIRFINGVEISVTWRGRGVHIVGLDFDEHESSLQTLLARLRLGRIDRIEQIGAKLAKHGIAGAAEGALALATNREMVSRTHMADWLVQQGLVRNKQAAFTKYLGDGKCGFVRHQWADLAETVQAINQAGGLAVIAHPMRYDMSATARRQLFEEFKQLGGVGIEVHSGSCSLGDRLNYAMLAERYGLLSSVGSDFHRANDYSGGTLGACPELPPICDAIWTRFRNHSII
ncbi:PHP domain-containing protein [Kingella kingae]|uniref:PHP domain-containing protein n=1 Tax=Kingella kingae TaxID=504 RepID=UPI00254B1A86|nr:PHP domain-containing protein [Kingella kingae]MDK4528683.1 PHP domain-containing protein [Kingella kingae]MDK4543216.1 PHP domain-containing protein [Kingella kingae]MDK4563022.1 PHP domain-containing protein [Kingella kingae]MDK4602949.1 PHP domain-containing protein [Kingella kingae]MDK4632926.1 PHP domain-containing protein [Kingella kingae]